MIATFYDVLYQHAKFGGDRTTRAGCRCENWCVFLYVTLGLPARGGHISNKYCVTVHGSILMPFSAIFRLDALALSVIATATWLAGWVAGCLSQPVLYQND